MITPDELVGAAPPHECTVGCWIYFIVMLVWFVVVVCGCISWIVFVLRRKRVATVDEILKDIDELFGDTSVPRSETLDDMKAIRDAVLDNIDCIETDILATGD